MTQSPQSRTPPARCRPTPRPKRVRACAAPDGKPPGSPTRPRLKTGTPVSASRPVCRSTTPVARLQHADQPLTSQKQEDALFIRFAPPENELLMLLIRTHQQGSSNDPGDAATGRSIRPIDYAEPLVAKGVPSLEQTVRTWHAEGRSQRAIARELDIDRRKVKQIIDRAAALSPIRRASPCCKDQPCSRDSLHLRALWPFPAPLSATADITSAKYAND
jgi:hypothetical protein